MKWIFCLLIFALVFGCSDKPETYNGVEVYDHDSEELAGGPEFKQSKMKVVTLHKDQVQRRDFNGIFDITPDSARIVRAYWKQKFNELTRPGFYGDFFIEFESEKQNLAGAFPQDIRRKEVLLVSLENSFHNFCVAIGIGQDYSEYKKNKLE